MQELWVYPHAVPRGLTGGGALHFGRASSNTCDQRPPLTQLRAASVLLIAGIVCSTACNTTRGAEGPLQRTQAGGGAECAGRTRAANLLPGVKPEEATLAYWLQRYSAAELDNPLLDTEQIAAYDLRVGKRQGRDNVSQRDLRVPADGLELADDLRDRLSQLRPDVTSGKLLARNGQPLDERTRSPFGEPVKMQTPSLRVLLAPALLRCGPYEGGLYKTEVQLPYDRNACGALRPQEVIELLGKTSNGMWLARSRYSLGFLPTSTALAPAIPAGYQAAFLHGPRSLVSSDLQLTAADGTALKLASGVTLPVVGHAELVVADARGYTRIPANASIAPQLRPLTRRALLTAAFRELGKPYGLGDAEGGYDCSGLLLSLFDRFDIALPRFSGWQAQAGSYTVDVKGMAPAEKLRRLDLAAQSGSVLLHFPGHIMLYLGRSSSGVPLALHALGEYLEPCEGGKGETVVDVQRVVVSTLDLGHDTSRTSFLERMTRLVVFGNKPAALDSIADQGPPEPPSAPRSDEACKESDDAHIFVSPANPQPGETLRAVAISSSAPNGATLRIYDSDGDPIAIDEFGLGGPPYGRVARAARVRSGQYTAVFGSGGRRLACRKIRVHDTPTVKSGASEGEPIWEPRARWDRENEALFALFVEQLFTGPPDDEQTWTNLHSLLRDPNRNLLYNHLGRDEEEQLKIEPDCADLPYSLRAYFAWKLRLPYAFRQCTRGRSGTPPACGDLHTSLMPRKAADDVAAFSEFVNRAVRDGVHSATGRTAPRDSQTDLYPVALARNVLPPGTVYADPYGHVMMISKWFPQGSVQGDPYGVLMAAEAQPDGTIGRRRFWQGSFLFDPDTTSFGAGFKRFRPLRYEQGADGMTTLDNAALTDTREFAPYSPAQYQGTREDFYDRMDTLINPAPLAPGARMQSLVDALDESVKRRVLSVDNGEQYARAHPQVTINMPQGRDIFETEGAWEDFATPSRDMRLLIAIDTVLALPERVESKPERFALEAGTTPSAAAAQLREAMDRALHAHTFSYTRSDGSAQTLSLADVVARAAALEIAYNPNDCAEARWGAPQGSSERATCVRNANASQQARMQTYRTWFHTRTRPTRD